MKSQTSPIPQLSDFENCLLHEPHGIPREGLSDTHQLSGSDTTWRRPSRYRGSHVQAALESHARADCCSSARRQRPDDKHGDAALTATLVLPALRPWSKSNATADEGSRRRWNS